MAVVTMVEPQRDNITGGHTERRRQQRYPFYRELNVVIRRRIVSARARDLSVEGMALELPFALAPEQDIALLVPLKIRGADGDTSAVGGEIVWCGGGVCGVRFVEATEQFSETLRQLLSQYLVHASSREVQAFIRSSARDSRQRS